MSPNAATRSFLPRQQAAPPRLQGIGPTYEWTDRNGDSVDEPCEVWYGQMRIVHGQRARKLRRRGERLMDLRAFDGGPARGYSGKAKFAWFVGDPADVRTSGYAQ